MLDCQRGSNFVDRTLACTSLAMGFDQILVHYKDYYYYYYYKSILLWWHCCIAAAGPS